MLKYFVAAVKMKLRLEENLRLPEIYALDGFWHMMNARISRFGVYWLVLELQFHNVKDL